MFTILLNSAIYFVILLYHFKVLSSTLLQLLYLKMVCFSYCNTKILQLFYNSLFYFHCSFSKYFINIYSYFCLCCLMQTLINIISDSYGCICHFRYIHYMQGYSKCGSLVSEMKNDANIQFWQTMWTFWIQMKRNKSTFSHNIEKAHHQISPQPDN